MVDWEEGPGTRGVQKLCPLVAGSPFVRAPGVSGEPPVFRVLDFLFLPLVAPRGLADPSLLLHGLLLDT